MEYNKFRIKSPVKSFRDLEVYQKTIQLSDEITNLPFLSKEQFQQDNQEIKSIAEKIPKLIAEAYGDKFDSKELAHKKLTESITFITNAITKIDLLRQRFIADKVPAPAIPSSKPFPKLSEIDKNPQPDNYSNLPRAADMSPQVTRVQIAGAGAVSADITKEAKETLDNLLTRHQTQKVKVLNLRKAWDRIYTNYPQNECKVRFKRLHSAISNQ